jgi:uncharacterized membrane-anchored protein YitT (DUF2179 family)
MLFGAPKKTKEKKFSEEEEEIERKLLERKYNTKYTYIKLQHSYIKQKK